ncbi:hypothetical protein baBA2_000991 (plasmid) [Borrelia anserina]|uniref:Uncharacterized protein n=1 Tax=Borrelia anserina BA2 TaxID=1313293 RepID=W5SVG4_BORAN|nr:hypothetical protein [Borrelia anserina]AHH09021.1 hypothetical protein BAN_0900024 [Borrelia anserina BA2]UPA07360.1 hypothetical protein baBA2_000991 [Borrelia anserina]
MLLVTNCDLKSQVEPQVDPQSIPEEKQLGVLVKNDDIIESTFVGGGCKYRY